MNPVLPVNTLRKLPGLLPAGIMTGISRPLGTSLRTFTVINGKRLKNSDTDLKLSYNRQNLKGLGLSCGVVLIFSLIFKEHEHES